MSKSNSWNDLDMSFKVISYDLPVVHCNYISSSYHFQDVSTFRAHRIACNLK